MARTGFGPWSRVLSGPYRLAVLRQATSPKCSKSASSAPGVLLLPGNTLGYCPIQKGELASSAPIRYPPPLTRARQGTTSCRAFMPWTITFSHSQIVLATCPVHLPGQRVDSAEVDRSVCNASVKPRGRRSTSEVEPDKGRVFGYGADLTSAMLGQIRKCSRIRCPLVDFNDVGSFADSL